MEKGLPENFAQDVVVINASISSGKMGEQYEKNKPELGNIKMERYEMEFTKAYHKRKNIIQGYY